MISPPRDLHRSSEPSPIDAAVATLVFALFLFSLASAVIILHFHLFSSTGAHRLRGLNSLWSVRILLITFAALWSLSELLRLPNVLHLLSLYHRRQPFSYTTSLRLCRAYLLTSHALFQPCFFITLLFLLKASLDDRRRHHMSCSYRTNDFVVALATSLAGSFPFFALHVLVLDPSSSWALHKLQILPDFIRKIVRGMGIDQESSMEAMRCAYPLFSTVLLAAFGIVYVPYFLSACLRAADVVINRKLRVRLHALAAAVLFALTVQIIVLSLAALWKPNDSEFQVLGLVGFLVVLVCALVGEGILVVRPIREAAEVGCWGRSAVGGDREHDAAVIPAVA